MEQKSTLQAAQAWVREELERSVRFWLDHGMDREHGGVYTCLDRKGEVYSKTFILRNQHYADIMAALAKGAKVVSDHPRHDTR